MGCSAPTLGSGGLDGVGHEDGLKSARAQLCAALPAGEYVPSEQFCNCSSMGHPNPTGAVKCADAIYPFLE